MARFCGGIHIDDSLKIINGVICDAGATSVDVANALTTCGQLWDGELFAKVTYKGRPVVTCYDSETGAIIDDPVPIRGNCGVALDERYFKINDGMVGLHEGFILTVITDPTTASITVMDADSEEIGPISYNTNIFLLPGIGDQYSVTVQKDGYTGKTQTITNNGDQTITIVLEEEPQT